MSAVGKRVVGILCLDWPVGLLVPVGVVGVAVNVPPLVPFTWLNAAVAIGCGFGFTEAVLARRRTDAA